MNLKSCSFPDETDDHARKESPTTDKRWTDTLIKLTVWEFVGSVSSLDGEEFIVQWKSK